MTAQNYYRRIYFEAIDLMMNAIDQRFDQPSFDTYAKMESLFIKTLNLQDKSEELKSIHPMQICMADHSVVAWNELYESEASWASVFCFDNASSEKYCFAGDLDCFISLCLRVLNVPECHQKR